MKYEDLESIYNKYETQNRIYIANLLPRELNCLLIDGFFNFSKRCVVDETNILYIANRFVNYKDDYFFQMYFNGDRNLAKEQIKK